MKGIWFKAKLLKLGYEPTSVDGLYKYHHTHGEMVVSFYSNDTVYIYWKPEDEKKIIHYNGITPKTSVEIETIIKLLKLKMS